MQTSQLFKRSCHTDNRSNIPKNRPINRKQVNQPKSKHTSQSMSQFLQTSQSKKLADYIIQKDVHEDFQVDRLVRLANFYGLPYYSKPQVTSAYLHLHYLCTLCCFRYRLAPLHVL